MHDSYLLHRIASNLKRICNESNIEKIREAIIEVSYNSHIDNENLHEHLLELLPDLLDKDAVITVKKTDIEEQTAVIYMLKGDGLGTRE